MNPRTVLPMIRDTSAQDRPIASRAPGRKRWAWLAVAGAVGAAVVFVAPAVARLLGAQASVSRSRLSIATVRRGPFVREIASEGRVVATVSPTVYAPEEGTVALKVHAGDRVEQGQVLAVVDSPELASQLALAQAQLQSLEVEVQRGDLQVRESRVDLQQAVSEAELERTSAQFAVKSARKAFQTGGLSRLEVERAEIALSKAELQLKDAQQKQSLGADRLVLEAKAKRLERDRQRLLVADLQRRVASLTVRSPVTGQVGELLTSQSAHVPKDGPVLTVVDLSALEVEAKVPESFAHDLAPGMPAQLEGNGEDWKGVVSAISPAVVDGQVSLRVRFAGAKPEQLRQNQRLSVRILIDRLKDAVTVTRGAFVDESGGRWAYVVHDGLAERRPIRLGPSSIDRVVVLQGLSPGDQVVISGTDSFHGAARVALSP